MAVPQIQLKQVALTNPHFVAITHGNTVTNNPMISTCLHPLNESAQQIEYWDFLTTQPIPCHQQGALNYAVYGDMLFGYLPFTDNDSLEQVTSDFYQTLMMVLKECGGFYPLKIWHYLPNLYEDDTNVSAYQTFCKARSDVIQDYSDDTNALTCAATVIGNNASTGVYYFLASRIAGQAIENPRQTNAYDYPLHYTNPAPIFSRAVIHSQKDTARLYISGTASIVDHRSMHHDVTTQLDEIANNLDVLLISASQENPLFSNKNLHDLQCIKIYLRDMQDCEKVLHHLPKRFGQLSDVQIFAGQICRKELLVELEAMVEV